jgi:hypothetical protein
MTTMTTPDIKTFLVDGGMPGCGRSLAVRALTDLYQHGHDNGYLRLTEGRIPECRVYVWDACNDPDTKTGYQLWHERGTATVHTGRFGTEEGAGAYAMASNLALEAAKEGPARFIIDLPDIQSSEAIRKHLTVDLLLELNTIPVWLLTRQAMSLWLLADRVAVMPEIYRRRGVVFRNSWFSPEDGFTEWMASGLRMALVEHGGWQDIFLLALNHYAKAAMDNLHVNMPFDIANERALEDGTWMHWYRIALQLFRGEAMFRCNRVESL